MSAARVNRCQTLPVLCQIFFHFFIKRQLTRSKETDIIFFINCELADFFVSQDSGFRLIVMEDPLVKGR